MIKFLMSIFGYEVSEGAAEPVINEEPAKIGDTYSSESEWVNPNKNGLQLQHRFTIINITKDGNKILCKYDIYDGKKSGFDVEHDSSILKYEKKVVNNS